MGANAPSPYGHPAAAPPRRKNRTAIVVVAVVAVMGVLFFAGPMAVVMLVRRATPGATEVDPKTVPKLIRKHMPCKRSCAVTRVVLHEGSFSVTVVSEDIEERTLTYRVYQATGAELSLSQDGLHPSSRVTIDLDEVDWSVAGKLVRKLEAKAVSGRSVSYVQLSPCEYDKEAEEPVRACFKANVLTEKGDLEVTLDAKTGKRR